LLPEKEISMPVTKEKIGFPSMLDSGIESINIKKISPLKENYSTVSPVKENY
jgi:hypothetical protein